jgi:hypothetical protein
LSTPVLSSAAYLVPSTPGRMDILPAVPQL